MQKVILDLLPGGVAPIVYASQYDDGRSIRFMLTVGGPDSQYSLNASEVITCNLTKPDGTETVINVANPGAGKTYVDLVNGADDYDQAGAYLGEIVLTKDARVIGSANFVLKVEEDAYGGQITTLTATGNPCTFTTDLADALVSLTADIVCGQDLHGYDHPWAGGAGKNKLHITATSQTINGITYTVKSDGTITANGTATAESTLVLVNGTGIFDFTTEMVLNGSVDGFGSSVRTRFGVSGVGSYDDFGNGVTIPIISDISARYSYVQITIASGTTVNNVTFKPMISTTGGDFEPYSNICPIVGHSELNLTRCGKNLFDANIENVIEGANRVTINGNVITNTATSAWAAVRFKQHLPKGTYVISASSIIPTGNVGAVQVSLYNGGYQQIAYIGSSLVSTFTLTEDNDVYFSLFSSQPSGVEVTDLRVNIGSSALPYEPYNGTPFTVAFGQTVYGGVYDKSGRLTIEPDTKITLDGTENWTLRELGANTATFMVYGFKNNVKNELNQMCSHFTFNADAYLLEHINTFVQGESGNLFIQVDKNIADNANDFKTWLATQYANGTPVEYTYNSTATPIVIDVPSISVFAENGTNNIISDCGGDVDVTYIKKV